MHSLLLVHLEAHCRQNKLALDLKHLRYLLIWQSLGLLRMKLLAMLHQWSRWPQRRRGIVCVYIHTHTFDFTYVYYVTYKLKLLLQ